METALASELNVLAHALDRIAERNRTVARLHAEQPSRRARRGRRVLPRLSDLRRRATAGARRPRGDRSARFARARRRNPAIEPSIFDFLREVVLPRGRRRAATTGADRTIGASGYPPAYAEKRSERLRFAMKFQQYTGPVQAKGRRGHRVLPLQRAALAERGRRRPGRGSACRRTSFHEANRRRRERLRARCSRRDARHEARRGRARAAERARPSFRTSGRARSRRWMRINQAHRPLVDGEPAPDRNDEYRFYQALVGVCPSARRPRHALPHDHGRFLVHRLRDDMNKSIKEAKTHTTWINENRAYDVACPRSSSAR